MNGMGFNLMSDVFPVAGVFLLAYFTAWFMAAEAIRNASIVDIGWGAGFVLLAALQLARGFSVPGFLLAFPIWVWGVRLAWHIGRRNWGKPEDFRYAAFRRDWAKRYRVRAYFQLFLFQGFLMGVISLPFLFGIRLAERLQDFTGVRLIPMGAGLLLWLAGFLLEAISDAQLGWFTRNPGNKGKVMSAGVWGYSRHTNYFGEAVSWWGIWLAALSVGTPWWTVIGPMTITFFLRYVSGVPMLEKRMESRAGYAEYAARTPIFMPLRFRRP